MEEKPCQDCGHFAFFHEEDEFKFDEKEERAKEEAKKLEISSRIQAEKIRVEARLEARRKAKANRAKEEELFAKEMAKRYKTALDEMVEDNAYMADVESGHKKGRRDSKRFRRNQKEKRFLDILNIREFYEGKQQV